MIFRKLCFCAAVFALSAGSGLGAAEPRYFKVDRIESMPAMPDDYALRDWKSVVRGYTRLVLNSGEGDNMPLSRLGETGFNYPGFRPLYLDTYVGSKGHGKSSEAINVIPAVVSAYLNGCAGLSEYPLVEGVMNFYNARNSQNVYLNNFSAHSGSDWWYDLMPNVYFYQLYGVAPMPDPEVALAQYRSVADRWLECVYALGGDPATGAVPDMNYRAFNLATQKPLATGVKEPESAGSIAWILFHAYLRTGETRYLDGAALSMRFLSGLETNPSYELQLAYGVQAAAKMNAIAGYDFDVCRLFRWCFDRGPLRGWGACVGKWGDYSMAGLIGEANDRGDDYVFVMNGFQQAAALAPAVRYDKRLARGYGRWMVNLVSASRWFYPGFLPMANSDAVSLGWSREHDPESVIPFEAIKQKFDGKTPYARGDARQGGWASTNLSLYSGSSVGYLAAVVDSTDVKGILRLDLCATDPDGRDKYPAYLYYNPYDAEMNVTVTLPSGVWSVYDAISEMMVAEEASEKVTVTVPSDGTAIVTLVPSGVELREEDGCLVAIPGDGKEKVVVDYARGWRFASPDSVTLPDRDDEAPRFRIENGEVVCDSPDVTVTGLWSAEGLPLAAPPASGLCIVSYRHQGRASQAKLLS